MCPGAVRPDGKDSAFWRLDEVIQPCPVDAPVWRPDILITVETSIDSLDEELRKLSLEIHGKHQGPEEINLILAQNTLSLVLKSSTFWNIHRWPLI